MIKFTTGAKKGLAVMLCVVVVLGSFAAGFLTRPKGAQMLADYKIQNTQDDPRYAVAQHLESMHPWLFVIDIETEMGCCDQTNEVSVWLWFDSEFLQAQENINVLFESLAFTAELVAAYYPGAAVVQVHYATVVTQDCFEGTATVAKGALSIRAGVEILLEWGKGETTPETFTVLHETGLVVVHTPGYFSRPLYHIAMLPRASNITLPWE